MTYKLREKYIDEAIGGPWFIFGQHPEGSVDVSGPNQDVFTKLPREVAEEVVKLHSEFSGKLYELLGWKPEQMREARLGSLQGQRL